MHAHRSRVQSLNKIWNIQGEMHDSTKSTSEKLDFNRQRCSSCCCFILRSIARACMNHGPIKMYTSSQFGSDRFHVRFDCLELDHLSLYFSIMLYLPACCIIFISCLCPFFHIPIPAIFGFGIPVSAFCFFLAVDVRVRVLLLPRASIR